MTPSVTCIAVTPPSNILWLSSDGHLRNWNGVMVSSPTSVPPSRYLSHGSTIALGHETEPTITFLHLTSFTRISSIKAPIGSVIALTPPMPGGFFATVHDSNISIYDYAARLVASFLTSHTVFSACFDQTRTRLITGDTKGSMHIHDIRKLSTNTHKTHNSFISSIACASDMVATASWDRRAHIHRLNFQDNTIQRMATTVPAKSKLHAVALSSDAKLLATAGATGSVSVWRIQDVNHKRFLVSPLAQHQAHMEPVFCLAFSQDNRELASGSADGTVHLFGVPTKPILISQKPPSGNSAAHDVQPVGIILTGQRADRKLIFRPSTVVTLACPICASAYDAATRTPVVSGICGHTFACKICCDRLWETDRAPKCPVCRASLLDVALNYELLSILSAAQPSGSIQSSAAGSSQSTWTDATDAHDNPLKESNHINLDRLSWLEIPELAFASSHTSIVYAGQMDGEVVAIRVTRKEDEVIRINTMSATAETALTRDEEEKHIRCMLRMRAPHITQLYGVSRMAAPDNRLVVVSELPPGGTLASNLEQLQAKGEKLTVEGMLSLSLQLIRALRYFHESDVSAGHALSMKSVALSVPLTTDWSLQQRIKFIELGGTTSKAQCGVGNGRTFPSDYVGYLAPEVLDEDHSTISNKEAAFQKACSSDMYSLGVMLWEAATGKQAFDGLRPAQVVAAVIGRKETPGIPPEWLPLELQSLISQLWSHDTEKRPNAKEACSLLEEIPSAPPLPTTT